MSVRRAALHIVPTLILLGWLAPLVQDRLAAYLVVACVAKLAWLLGAVMGLSQTPYHPPPPPGRNPP